MKEARDCQQQKDHNDQSLQHRKAEAIKLCEIARAEARPVRARGRRPTNLLINLPYMQLKKLNNNINNLSRTLKWLGSSLKPLEDVLYKIELWVILRAITSHLIAAQASRVRDRDVARVLNYETDTRQ